MHVFGRRFLVSVLFGREKCAGHEERCAGLNSSW